MIGKEMEWIEEVSLVSTHNVSTVAMCHTSSVRSEKTRLGTGYSFGLVVALGLVLCACSPAERDSFPERPSGVSVQEHWATLDEIEDQLERTAAMAQFVTTLGSEDSDALLELVNLRKGVRGLRSVEFLILMNAWSRVDPERAMALATPFPTPVVVAARADGIREWASKDPMAAVAAADENDAEIRRSIVRGWYESGRPGLSDFVLSRGTSQPGQHYIGLYAAELGHEKGAEGVAEWIDSVRAARDLESTIVFHVHRKGMVAMAGADAEAAIAYCDIHCDEPYADSARSRLADRLGWLGLGERAIAWVEASEDADPAERTLAGRAAYTLWFKTDRNAALAWADEARKQYADEAWFQEIGRFVLSMRTRFDPESALEWITMLPPGRDQEEAMITIVRFWRERDENAAEVWLESSPLDDDARAKARTPMKYRGQDSKPDPQT
jgi:hypothetical protein